MTYMLNLEPGGFGGYVNKLASTQDLFYLPFLNNVPSLANWLMNEQSRQAPSSPFQVDDVFIDKDSPSTRPTGTLHAPHPSIVLSLRHDANSVVPGTTFVPWLLHVGEDRPRSRLTVGARASSHGRSTLDLTDMKPEKKVRSPFTAVVTPITTARS